MPNAYLVCFVIGGFFFPPMWIVAAFGFLCNATGVSDEELDEIDQMLEEEDE